MPSARQCAPSERVSDEASAEVREVLLDGSAAPPCISEGGLPVARTLLQAHNKALLLAKPSARCKSCLAIVERYIDKCPTQQRCQGLRDPVWRKILERQRPWRIWSEHTCAAAAWSPDPGISRAKEGQGRRANSGSEMGDTRVVSYHDLTTCQQGCQMG